jgi:hypothetical protein
VSCGFWGDSLTVGLAAVAASLGCDTSAVVGRNAAQIAAHPLPAKRYRWVVISAGSNPMRRTRFGETVTIDPTGSLGAMRLSVDAKCVIWIKPAHSAPGKTVERVAGAFGDKVVSFKAGKDGLHPKSYRALWRAVRLKLC